MLQAKLHSPQALFLNFRARNSARPQSTAQRLHRPRATAKEEKESADTLEQTSSQEEAKQQASTSGEEASRQDLRDLANTRRQLAREDNLGLIEGILDETRRISWPSPLQALKDTVTVVGIVTVSAIVLFGLNTALTEGSKLFYSQLGR